METLTSPHNPLLKAIRRAVSRGELTGTGFCVVEGPRLIEEAGRSGCAISALLFAESALDRADRIGADLSCAPAYSVPDALFGDLSTTDTSQGALALVRPPSWTLHQILAGEGVLVVLDGVQEPGNAGAIVRTAEAFGASGVVFLKGTVGPFNPKTLRASAGSLFRLPFVHDIEDPALRAALKQKCFSLFVTVPRGGTLLHDARLVDPCALVIGSEGRGVRPELSGGAVGLRIPTRGVESLNASVAAGVVLYEAQRQRAAS